MINQFIKSPVVPVLTLHNEKQALDLTEIFLKYGLFNLEVTLRTEKALDCIKVLIAKFPEANIGAGTIITIKQLKIVEDLGVSFAISPGFSIDLALAAKKSNIFYLPGASTPSEVMRLNELGYQFIKFFHAKNFGGISMLKAYSEIFPKIRFCPTGGIAEKDFEEYLNLKNVFCLGGSWLTAKEDLNYKQTEIKVKNVMKKISKTPHH